VAAGNNSVALKVDGTVVAWGYNGHGESSVPAALNNVVRISGSEHILALKSDGTVVAWGNNASGQATVPAGLTNVVSIAAGGYHSLALRGDGTVLAWGENSNGQISVPIGLVNVIAIAAGGYHSVALKADGTVVVFGSHAVYGPSTPPLGLRDLVALGVAGGGANHSLGLKADGSVVAWGRSQSGQTQVPLGLGNVVGLATGGNFSLAIRDASRDLKPTIASQPSSITVTSGQRATFTVGATAGTANLNYQWRKDGVSISGATAASYSVDPVVSGSNGNYDVIISNYLGTIASAAVLLAINPLPVIAGQPVAMTVEAGKSASFSVVVVGGLTVTYQWQKNGTNIVGATSATYSIASPQEADSGAYACLITNSVGSVTSSLAALAVVQGSRLANVSVRTTLASAQTLIVGFVVSGGAKDVVVRAAGPALAQFGLTAAMADPRLELYKDSTKVLENDNWPGVLANTFSNLGAFPFLPNSRDAALMQNLNGGYSVLANGSGPGVVLVEAYDAGSGNTARLVNLSARNRVGTGPDILFAGFFVAGTGNKRVLIRAVGPTIGGAPFNVPNVLLDPKLEVYDANAVKIAENDNWDGALAATFLSVGAFALAPGSKDAALIVTLNAGSGFTAQVKGADGGTGDALIEVYELP